MNPLNFFCGNKKKTTNSIWINHFNWYDPPVNNLLKIAKIVNRKLILLNI